jgi:hypothetical protein
MDKHPNLSDTRWRDKRGQRDKRGRREEAPAKPKATNATDEDVAAGGGLKEKRYVVRIGDGDAVFIQIY